MLGKTAMVDTMEREFLIACLWALRYPNPKSMKSITTSPLKVQFQCDRARCVPKAVTLSNSKLPGDSRHDWRKAKLFQLWLRNYFYLILDFNYFLLYNYNVEKWEKNSKQDILKMKSLFHIESKLVEIMRWLEVVSIHDLRSVYFLIDQYAF